MVTKEVTLLLCWHFVCWFVVCLFDWVVGACFVDEWFGLCVVYLVAGLIGYGSLVACLFGCLLACLGDNCCFVCCYYDFFFLVWFPLVACLIIYLFGCLADLMVACLLTWLDYLLFVVLFGCLIGRLVACLVD